jgi:tetratricopeptide (TPR) repeat protein
MTQAETRTGPVILEGARPLSRSLIWSITREYFERLGVDAFAFGAVPFMLTSGPILARRYAQVIEGFVADCKAGRLGPVDQDEPIYIVELGAGSGRLAFMIMQHLDEEAIAPMRLVYVLTDMAASTVDFYRNRRELQQFVEAGRMDFAVYEAGSDAPIHLQHAGTDLVPAQVVNPMIGISNYLFCAIPQDLYSVLGDELREEHVAVLVHDPTVDSSTPDFLKKIVLATAHAPVKADRYDGGRLDRILRAAAERHAGGKKRFSFAPLAIKAIDSLLDLSGNRLCMLVGERASQPFADVDDDDPGEATTAYTPGALMSMGIHGSTVSVPVDIEVMRIAAEDAGAELLVQGAESPQILVTALLAGDSGGPGSDARSAFDQAFGETAVDDLVVTVKTASLSVNLAVIDSIYAAIRVSSYDPYTLVRFYPALEALLPEATEVQKDELERIAERVYGLSYPLEEVSDLAFGIGSLLGIADRFESAIEYYEKSRADRGPRPQVCYDAALCHLQLGQRDEALLLLDEAIALDEDYEMAKKIRGRVMSGEHFVVESAFGESAAARLLERD